MLHFDRFEAFDRPFPHWVADDFIDAQRVRAINATWPSESTPGWRVEGASWATKGSLLFPHRLPGPAHELAADLMSLPSCRALSRIVGIPLQPDPWFMEGPDAPRLGGGLHEIPPGGKLNVHVDFEAHPSGLRRVCNLLIYLNDGWKSKWGGALELHGQPVGKQFGAPAATISPQGGRAVLFVTTPDSWHGHPHPLTCPPDSTRRSLALYYYAEAGAGFQRPKTVYITKG